MIDYLKNICIIPCSASGNSQLTQQYVITVLSIIVSGLISLLISSCYYRKGNSKRSNTFSSTSNKKDAKEFP